jgi:hypothetical protein
MIVMNLSRLYDFKKIYNNIDKYDNKIIAKIRNINIYLYKINNSRWGVHKDNKDIDYNDLEKYHNDIISYPLPDQLHQYIKDNTCFKYGYWRKGLSKNDYISTHELSKFFNKTHVTLSNLITDNLNYFKYFGKIIYEEINDSQLRQFTIRRIYYLNELQLIFIMFLLNHSFNTEISKDLLDFKVLLTKNYKNKDYKPINYIRNYLS